MPGQSFRFANQESDTMPRQRGLPPAVRGGGLGAAAAVFPAAAVRRDVSFLRGFGEQLLDRDTKRSR